MKTRISLSLVICLLAALMAQATDNPPQLSAGHEKMLEWCGQATITGQTFTTPLGPGHPIKGTWTGKPILGGFAIEGDYSYEGHGPNGETQGKEIITYDPKTDKYTYTFLTDTGYCETAPFTQEGAVAAWQTPIVRDGKQYQLRGSDTDLPDDTGFVRKEQISTDGQTWLPFHESRFVFDEASASDEQELIRLQHEWSRVEVAGDVDALDHLLADEYVLTLADGTALPKAKYLRDVRSEDTRSTALAVENPTVRLYGDMALVQGIVKWTEPSGQKHEDLFHETWLKRDGRWQCLATQESEIAQSPIDIQKLSPEMKKLAPWVGRWSYEGEQAAPPVAGLPYGPAGTFFGTVTARFVLGGRFLEETIEDNNPGGKTGLIAMTGYNARTRHYATSVYVDDGSTESSVQTATPDGRIWTSRSTVTTSQGDRVPMRSVKEFSPDGTRYTVTVEISPDQGQTWKHWFNEKAEKQQD